jgi:hypothetical protein|tara:strand:- start:1340 stop:1828 length:489 start_codon:yes stop_codon:yes gene_type:complete
MSTSVLDLVQSAAARQKAWSLPFDAVDPTGANDHFFHARNTGARSLAIVQIEVSSTVAGNLEPFRASGTSSNTPTAITAASLSGPGGPNPVGTYETGVNLDLTEGDFLARYYLAADTPRLIDTYIVIPTATAVAFNWEVATGVVTGQVIIVELTPDDDPVKD